METGYFLMERTPLGAKQFHSAPKGAQNLLQVLWL